MTYLYQNTELKKDSSDTIDISNRDNGQMDPYGYITNLESEIDIRIDQHFMNLLEDAGIDSEPEVSSLHFSLFTMDGNFGFKTLTILLPCEQDGIVHFVLVCEINQGDDHPKQFEKVS